MSQKTIYTCDQCQKTIGENKHISVSFGNYSGVALKDKGGYWGVHQKLIGQFRHFCDGVCIGRYFSDLMRKVK